jgi:hypothetical protein
MTLEERLAHAGEITARTMPGSWSTPRARKQGSGSSQKRSG